MGIQNIWPLLASSGHTTSLEYYASKKVAIDTSIWLHQYAHVTHGADLSNSLLFGLFCRILKLKFYGIKPLFVFDGKTPALKQKCLERRKKKWNDEKRMKGALKKLIMREKVKAKVEQRLNGVVQSEDMIEQERKEQAGELNFNINSASVPDVSDEIEKALDESEDVTLNEKDEFISTEILVLSDSEKESADDVEIVSANSRRNSKLPSQNVGMHNILAKDFNFNLEAPRESTILLDKEELDPEVFQQLPEDIQKELLKELENRANYKYSGGSAMLTQAQGGGIGTFSQNQLDLLVKSNTANRSLRLLKERESEEINTSDNTVNSESNLSTIWSGKDAQGDIVEIIEMSQNTSQNTSNNLQKSLNQEIFGEEEYEENEFHESEVTSHIENELQEGENMEGGFIIEGGFEPESNTEYNTIEGGFLPDDDDDNVEIPETIQNVSNDDGEWEEEWENDTEDEYSVVETLNTSTTDQLKALNIDPNVFLSLPTNVIREIVANFQSLPSVSPIQPSPNTSISMHDDSWEEIDIRSIKNPSNPSNSSNPSNQSDVTLSRNLFPTSVFDTRTSLEEFSKSVNQSITELEDGVSAVDVHSLSTFKISESPTKSSPSLSRSFELENLELSKAYAIENPGYTPVEHTQKEDGFSEFSPAMYDTSTPNTLFPEYQRRIQLLNSRREGSLAVYNEHRELINQLFQYMGVPYIQSPYEADAQCGFLSQKNMVDAIISDDSDIFIFGGLKLLKFAFSKTGSKHIEEYTMEAISEHLGLSRRDLIAMAMLLGCDYTEGVHNVGPVTAVEVIEAFRPSPEEAEAMNDEEYIMTILNDFSNWANLMSTKRPTKIETSKDRFMKKYFNLKKRAVFPSGFPDRMIVRAYLHPQVDTNEDQIEWGEFTLTSDFYEFANQYLGLDVESVNKYIDPVLQKQREREQQTNIMSYVGKTRLAKINSKRVKYAVSQLKRKRKIKDESITGDDATQTMEDSDEVGMKSSKRKKIDTMKTE